MLHEIGSWYCGNYYFHSWQSNLRFEIIFQKLLINKWKSTLSWMNIMHRQNIITFTLKRVRLHSDSVINSIAADRGSRIAGTEAWFWKPACSWTLQSRLACHCITARDSWYKMLEEDKSTPHRNRAMLLCLLRNLMIDQIECMLSEEKLIFFESFEKI